MSTIRVADRQRRTTIDNRTLEDSRLSWRARGLLAYLLSKPDAWQINRDHLAREAPDGVRAVRSALQEMEEAGYLVRRQVRQSSGRLAWEHLLFERPPVVENAPVVRPGKTPGQTSGALTAGGERAALVITEESRTEKPSAASPEGEDGAGSSLFPLEPADQTSAKTKGAPKTREPNPIFEAIERAVGYPPKNRGDFGRWGAVAKKLQEYHRERSPAEIAAEIDRRAPQWKRLFPGATLTETALLKHWSRLDWRNPMRATS